MGAYGKRVYREDFVAYMANGCTVKIVLLTCPTGVPFEVCFTHLAKVETG